MTCLTVYKEGLSHFEQIPHASTTAYHVSNQTLPVGESGAVTRKRGVWGGVPGAQWGMGKLPSKRARYTLRIDMT